MPQIGTTYTTIIGEVIKNIRKKKHINQREIAETIGMSQAGWSKIESGKIDISISQLAKVAAFLKVETHKIIEYADKTVADFEHKNIAVNYDNKEAVNNGLMLLGAAAIGAVATAIMLNKK